MQKSRKPSTEFWQREGKQCYRAFRFVYTVLQHIGQAKRKRINCPQALFSGIKLTDFVPKLINFVSKLTSFEVKSINFGVKLAYFEAKLTDFVIKLTSFGTKLINFVAKLTDFEVKLINSEAKLTSFGVKLIDFEAEFGYSGAKKTACTAAQPTAAAKQTERKLGSTSSAEMAATASFLFRRMMLPRRSFRKKTSSLCTAGLRKVEDANITRIATHTFFKQEGNEDMGIILGARLNPVSSGNRNQRATGWPVSQPVAPASEQSQRRK